MVFLTGEVDAAEQLNTLSGVQVAFEYTDVNDDEDDDEDNTDSSDVDENDDDDVDSSFLIKDDNDKVRDFCIDFWMIV